MAVRETIFLLDEWTLKNYPVVRQMEVKSADGRQE